MPLRHALAAAVLMLATTPAHAQEAPGRIAQLFSYTRTDEAAFDAGYRKHLEWHARAGDQLVWYAWEVTSGERLGLFIDGTFGTTFAGLDSRPDPAGDGADFAATAGPYATARSIETWEYWTEASTSDFLERREPSPRIDVFHVEVAPGASDHFEAAVEALRKDRDTPLAWYRLVRGGPVPSYLLLAPRSGWAGIDDAGRTLPELLARAYSSDSASTQAALESATAIRSESWRYLPRLSLIPGGPPAQ